MTPSQLAARLTIHEHASVGALENARLHAVDGAALPPPVRALRAVEGADKLPTPFERESLHRRLLAAADMLGASLALILALLLAGDARPALPALAGIPLVVVLFKVAGLYDRDQLRIMHSTLDELPLIVQLAGLYALSVTILQSILLEGRLSGLEIALLWGAAFAAIAGGRMVARWIAARRLPAERCLVIGEPERAARIREKLLSSRAHAAVIATLPFDDDDDGIPSSPESVHRIVRELHVDRIVIAPATTDARGVVELIRIAKAAGVRVSVLPRMLEAVGSTIEFEDVDGLTVLGVRPFGLSRSSRFLKRAFDLAATLIGLVAVGPLIALIALAIRLDSKGPIFFRQIRVGRDGRHFRIYKFRSMVVNAEEQKARLRALSEVGDEMFKIADDPRVTRVGGFLRRTSLDELPQMFNVLRGEMSLVGPRPLVTDEDALVLGLDRSRLHLTPGMTGPWQVLGARVPMQEMVGIDYLYVASWSLWADLKLLLRTVRHVARRGNV